MGTRSDKALAALVLAVGLLLFFPSAVLGDRVFFCRDQADVLVPMWEYVKERALLHQWPLWFPYDGLGAPLAGSTVGGIYNPLYWALLPLGVLQMFKVYSLGLIAAAFAATYALCRRLGCAGWAAAAGAVAYAFCGGMISMISNPQYQTGAAMLPVVLWGAALALQGHRLAGAAAGALGMAEMVLAGDIQSAYMAGCLLLGLIWVIPSETATLRTRLAVLVSTGVGALLLSAAQLGPSLEALGSTARGAGLSWQEATQWSLHPLRLPELFLGDLVQWHPGSAQLNAVREQLLGTESLWNTTVTVGALPLWGCIAALAGTTPRRARLDWGLAAAGTLGVWVATGVYGGLYRVGFAAIPLWSSFRFPEKWTVIACLPLCLLAARGLGRALREPPPQVRRALAIAVGVCLALAVAASAASLARSADDAWRLYLGRLAWGLGGAAALGAALWAAGGRSLRPSALFLVPLVALGGSGWANRGTAAQCTAPQALAEVPSPVAVSLATHAGASLGRYRTGIGTELRSIPKFRPELWENPSDFARLAVFRAQVLYPDHGSTAGIETFGRHLPVLTERLNRVSRTTPIGDLFRLFNAPYLVVEQGTLPASLGPDAEPVQAFDELGVSLLRLSAALPRAYLASPRVVQNLEEAVAGIRDPDVLAGKVAVVEGGPPAGATLAHGSVTVTAYAAEHVELSAVADADAVAILADGFYAGWRATVDGAPAQVYPANVLGRGIRIPPGTHQLTLDFAMSPWSRAGLGVSAAALAALLALAALRGRWWSSSAR